MENERQLFDRLGRLLSQTGPGALPYAERNKRVIREQLCALVQSYPLLRILDDREFTFNNGATARLLRAEGTVPIHYKGARYNIPMEIWLPESFPNDRPIAFVVPTHSMIIRTGHRHVDPNGDTLTPQLQSWSWPPSNLRAAVDEICAIFSADPPLFSKAAAPAHQPQRPPPHDAAARPHGSHFNGQAYGQQPPPPAAHAHAHAHPAPGRYPAVNQPSAQPPAPAMHGPALGYPPPPQPHGQPYGGAPFDRPSPMGAPPPGAYGTPPPQIHGDARQNSHGHAQPGAGYPSKPSASASATPPAHARPPAPSRSNPQLAAQPTKRDLDQAARDGAMLHLVPLVTRCIAAAEEAEADRARAQVDLGKRVDRDLATARGALQQVQEERAAVERAASQLSQVRDKLRTWLDSHSHLRSGAEAPALDGLVVPRTAAAGEQIAAECRARACDDAIGLLDRGLRRGALAPEPYLRLVRHLACEQFFALHRAQGKRAATLIGK
ncbi:unnamed protein product [Pedinophyceae sp. YPF-701]|nr:unnamed protein product [Pedinophyceae sp. YPF-701]